MVVLVTSVLAACSDDDPGPGPTPSSSRSVEPAETTTPEVTVTKPALLLGQPTAASAIAFVKYFIETYNYAYATYDTSPLDSISLPSCRYCDSVAKDVQRLQKARVKVLGSESLFVEAVLPTDELENNELYLLVVMSQRPGNAVAPDGTKTRVKGTKNVKTGFGLDWDGGKWLVRGVSIEAKGTPWPG